MVWYHPYHTIPYHTRCTIWYNSVFVGVCGLCAGLYVCELCAQTHNRAAPCISLTTNRQPQEGEQSQQHETHDPIIVEYSSARVSKYTEPPPPDGPETCQLSSFCDTIHQNNVLYTYTNTRSVSCPLLLGAFAGSRPSTHRLRSGLGGEAAADWPTGRLVGSHNPHSISAPSPSRQNGSNYQQMIPLWTRMRMSLSFSTVFWETVGTYRLLPRRSAKESDGGD